MEPPKEYVKVVEPITVKPSFVGRYRRFGPKQREKTVAMLGQTDQNRRHHKGVELYPHAQQKFEKEKRFAPRKE